MNEIEKMYENAGVEKELVYFECHRGRSSMRRCPISSDERDKGCSSCSFRDEVKEVYEYPPFTAERQIELIKWLLYHESIDYLKMSYTSEEGGILDISIKCMSGYSYENDDDDDFDIALASLINGLWQDLTEEEKQQIKEILSK